MTNKLPSAAINATGAPTGEAQVDPSATPPPALWQDIASAPRDGSYILAIYVPPSDGFNAHLSGRVFAVRHEGLADDGYDYGWALFPGYGGVPDRWLSHWMPLPTPPVTP